MIFSAKQLVTQYESNHHTRAHGGLNQDLEVLYRAMQSLAWRFLVYNL